MRVLLVGGWRWRRLSRKVGKEVFGCKRDALPNSLEKESLLDFCRDQSASAAAVLGIGPTVDPGHRPARHSCNGFEATTYFDDRVRRFHHGTVYCGNRNE